MIFWKEKKYFGQVLHFTYSIPQYKYSIPELPWTALDVLSLGVDTPTARVNHKPLFTWGWAPVLVTCHAWYQDLHFWQHVWSNKLFDLWLLSSRFPEFVYFQELSEKCMFEAINHLPACFYQIYPPLVL